MAKKAYQGSIILEILILLLSLLLVAVILVPGKIWEEEEKITNTCRYNLNAIYEAERFYFVRNEAYTDTLENLITFIQQDSSLQTKKQIVELTHQIYQVLNQFLDIPLINGLLTFSKSLGEISGDLVTNERYFRKYEEILDARDQLLMELSRFDSSASFPNFCRAKHYVDSLSSLVENISDYSLQTTAHNAQIFIDSLIVIVNKIETDAVLNYWNTERNKILTFVNDINKTDIKKVSSVGDRLQKFLDRANSSIENFASEDNATTMDQLSNARNRFEEIYSKFLSPEYFILTQRYGLLALSDVDSILISLSDSNFYCPDAKQRYILSISANSFAVECPNLLDVFQQELKTAVEPVRNLKVYDIMAQIKSTLDSTKNVMNTDRVYFRRYTDLLLDMKELLAEMDDINSVLLFRYTNLIKSFVDTVQTERRVSVLLPLIEDILNPMDTLAHRIETGNVRDLEEKLQYYGKKIERLDSLIEATKMPRSVKSKISKYYPIYERVFPLVEELKTIQNAEDVANLRQAARAIEKSANRLLKGYKERVYVIFYKKHINHGFIRDGAKSWEEAE